LIIQFCSIIGVHVDAELNAYLSVYKDFSPLSSWLAELGVFDACAASATLYFVFALLRYCALLRYVYDAERIRR